MKKLAIVSTIMIVSVLVTPQVTLAAWWNPMSWSVFSNAQTEISAQAPVSVNATITAVTKVQKTSTQKPTPNTTVKKSVKKSLKPAVVQLPVRTQVLEQDKPIRTLCNGIYWDSCPPGQNIICPVTGDAYCQVPQALVQPVRQKDNYQICRDAYGHATWDGSSYTSSGGPNCSCDTGYITSSDGKSCVVTQTAQQPDSSINNTVCQRAVKNLENFQTSYANHYAELSRTMADAYTVQARLGIFANQYNTALPAYQMAAQTACKAPASNSQCQTSLQKFDIFQAQNVLNSYNTSGTSQIIGNQQAMQLSNYQTDILYACQ